MKSPVRNALLPLFAGLLLAGAQAAAADINPAALAETCAGCHGSDGTSVGAAPTIDNLTEEYFVLSMKDYASGARASTVMGRIAKGYSEAETKAMAAYFDKKPFGRMAQAVDTSQLDKGKALQAKYCESCHEKDGRKSDGIGVLAGQRLTYMTYSIEDFKEGRRVLERRKKQKMDDLWADEGDAGYNAVLQYYASHSK